MILTSDFVLKELKRLKELGQVNDKNRNVLLECWLNKKTVKEYQKEFINLNYGYNPYQE